MGRLNPKPVWRGPCGDALLKVCGNTIVGSVEKDAFGRGWWAYGCDFGWQDVKLGLHDTEARAKRAVSQWVGDRI